MDRHLSEATTKLAEAEQGLRSTLTQLAKEKKDLEKARMQVREGGALAEG